MGESSAEQYGGLSYTFNIEKFTEVKPSVVDAIKDGMVRTWTRLIGTERGFNVRIASYLVDPQTGEKIDFSALYSPETDTFQFALDTAKEKIKLGLDEETTMFVLAAHETTHAVQVKKGVKLKLSKDNSDYRNNPYETEAWKVAASVLKDKYPGASGSIITGDIRVDL